MAARQEKNPAPISTSEEWAEVAIVFAGLPPTQTPDIGLPESVNQDATGNRLEARRRRQVLAARQRATTPQPSRAK